MIQPLFGNATVAKWKCALIGFWATVCILTPYGQPTLGLNESATPISVIHSSIYWYRVRTKERIVIPQ